MRTEEIAAMALERLDDDRYVLSNLLFARIKELGAGATPLVDMDVSKHKLADISSHSPQTHRFCARFYTDLKKAGL